MDSRKKVENFVAVVVRSHSHTHTHAHVQLLSTDSEELNRIFVLVVAQSLQISSKLCLNVVEITSLLSLSLSP